MKTKIITLATLKTAMKAIENRTDSSAWNRGVTLYARELMGDVTENVERAYCAAPQNAR